MMSNLLSIDPVIIWSAITCASSLLLLLYTQRLRAIRRLIVARVSIFVVVISLIMAVYSLQREYGVEINESLMILDDLFGLVTMILSATFAVGGAFLDKILQKVRVGVVIPSRMPFHMALRRGLADGLSGLRIDVDDEFLDAHRAAEDLTQFSDCLYNTLSRRPDYLIIGSPSCEVLDAPEIEKSLKKFMGRGGKIFFIENYPSWLEDRHSKKAAIVSSDSESGATVISRYINSIWDKASRIGFIAGPDGSIPSKSRIKKFQEELEIPEDLLLQPHQASFSQSAAFECAQDMMKLENSPSIIICANDHMALGVVRAISDLGLSKSVLVVGYDGIPLALQAIATLENSFAATIRIPPSQYGVVTSFQIREDLTDRWLFRSSVGSVTIPINPANLVTKHNVNELNHEN